jgi:aminocarboxymuconate-semialdehyde decarboxylase
MSAQRGPVIDIHAHAVLPETLGTAGAYGPEIGAEPDGTPNFRIGDYVLRGVRYRGSPFMDPEVRIAAMDRAGIDLQILSPNPLTYFHHIPATDAIAFCRIHNDAMAAVVARHPTRLGGLAALPMQDVPAAIDELDRAIGDLGLLGAAIGTDMLVTLDDARLDPLYARLTALNVPLFLHPGSAGIDGPPPPLPLRRYELDILIGYAAQETAAVATLIFGEVLHRHPGLDICISHGGGAIPFLYGRLKHAAHKRKWVPEHLRPDGAFEAALGRLWYDAHVHDPLSLAMLVDRVGTDHLVHGTNFAGWDAPEQGEAPPPGIDFSGNARRLLRID